jgi:hypothetical protein
MRKENNQATDARDECSKSSDRSCYRGASLEEEVQANVIVQSAFGMIPLRTSRPFTIIESKPQASRAWPDRFDPAKIQ